LERFLEKLFTTNLELKICSFIINCNFNNFQKKPNIHLKSLIYSIFQIKIAFRPQSSRSDLTYHSTKTPSFMAVFDLPSTLVRLLLKFNWLVSVCMDRVWQTRQPHGHIRAAWLVLWLLASGTAIARDHIIERSWLEDSSRQLSWAEVQQLPTQPYTGLLSKGFGNSVIWLRLRIDPHPQAPPTQSDQRLMLSIRPVYLDDIQVFDPLAPQGLAGVTGDLHHPRLDEYQGLDFLLPIHRGTRPRDVWLRLDSTSTRQIDVQALNLDDLNQRTLGQSLVFAMYVGLVALLAIWGITHWLFSRELIIGIFGLKEFTALLYALASLGHLRALWPAEWPASALHETSSVFSVTASSAAVLFHIQLIREFDPPLWLRRVHLTMVSMWLVKLALLMVWPITALSMNMLEILLYPWIFLLSVLLCRAWDKPDPRRISLSRPVVIGFYAILVVLLLLAALPGLGITSGNEIGLYIVQVHGLLTALLVLLMLQYRARVMQRQQNEIAIALERSQLLAQHESQLREEQEKLLTMLTHELKTPLATMHMRLDANANGSHEIKHAIRDMNSVIERCQQTLLLGDQRLQPHNDNVDMASIVSDVACSCPNPGRVQLDMPVRLGMHTDPQLWFIVLNNLLENACKYAAPDTPILIKLTSVPTESGSGMQFEIANEPGRAGWPEPGKLFEKYYRSPYARRQAGTGLGLYLVRKLMQVMGGSIEYAPTETQIRFLLTLPEPTLQSGNRSAPQKA